MAFTELLQHGHLCVATIVLRSKQFPQGKKKPNKQGYTTENVSGSVLVRKKFYKNKRKVMDGKTPLNGASHG